MLNNQKPWWVLDGALDGTEGLSQALRDSAGFSSQPQDPWAGEGSAGPDAFSASLDSGSESAPLAMGGDSASLASAYAAPVVVEAAASPDVQATGGQQGGTWRVLIQFAADAPPSIEKDIVGAAGGRIAGLVHAADHAAGDLIAVEFPTTTTQQFVNGALSNNPYVRFVELDSAVSVNLVSNDPAYADGTLWNMEGDQTTPFANAFGSQAGEAWGMGYIGAASVVAGVIDTGIDYTHPDLYLNVWINQGELPAGLVDTDGDYLITFRDLNAAANAALVTDLNGNCYIDGGDLLADPRFADGRDQDGNGYVDDLIGWDFANNDNDPMDDHNHGTHVSGTIGALGGNGAGVAGVNWSVEVMPLKFLSANGAGYTSNAIRALDYYTAMAARGGPAHYVGTNNSWSGGSYSQALQDSITRTASQQQLFIAAAGNNTNNNDVLANYPTNYSTLGTAGWDAVISVAALDSTGALASYSNYGLTSVDLAAPGSAIWSTLKGGYYGYYSGTSMASPHVTGALALLAASNPALGAATLKALLLSTVDPTASLAGKVATEGRLDIGSLLYAGTMDTTAPVGRLALGATGSDGSLSFSLTFSEDVSGLALDDLVVSNGTVTALSQISPSAYSLVVTPANGAEGQLVVTVRGGAVADTLGNPNATITSAPVTIDTLAPTLARVVTAAATDGAYLNSPVELQFSERIVAQAGSVTIASTAGVFARYALADSEHVTIDGNRLVIHADALLTASTSWSVIVDAGGLADVAGNRAGVLSASFATGTQVFGSKLVGTSAADVLVGDWGMDTLTGKQGVDRMDGRDGSDLYVIASADEHAAAEIVDTGTFGQDELRFAATTASTLVLFAGDTGLERVVIGTGAGLVADTSSNKQLNVDASQVLTGLTIIGNQGPNTLTGSAGNDILMGNGGNDNLIGGAGDDVLLAGLGADTLTGGAGADRFMFDIDISKKGWNTITDFQTGVDKLVLVSSIFTVLKPGVLEVSSFVTGSAPADANDYLIYNPLTGALSYDPDGSGKNSATVIAMLGTSTHPALQASDIIVVL